MQRYLLLLVLFCAVLCMLRCAEQPASPFPQRLDKITFSVIRSRHDPIDIAITRYADDNIVLTGEKLTFIDGGQLKKRVRYERKVLAHQYAELEAVLLDSSFRAAALADSATDIDGSTWYFGGTRHGFSFTCTWWTPTKDTMERGLYEVVKLGMRILALAEVRIPDEEFY